jgi:hypothetical protein
MGISLGLAGEFLNSTLRIYRVGEKWNFAAHPATASARCVKGMANYCSTIIRLHRRKTLPSKSSSTLQKREERSLSTKRSKPATVRE